MQKAPTSPELRFWELMKAHRPANPIARSVHLISLSDVDTQPLKEILIAQHMLCEHKNKPALWLIVVDTLGDPRLYDINGEALDAGASLLVLKPAGIEIEYGFFGSSSACWACYDQRRRLLDGPATYLYDVARLNRPVIDPPSYTTLTLELAYRHIVFEIEQLLREAKDVLSPGRLRVLQLDVMKISTHVVTRLPYCPACNARAVHRELPSVPQINLNKDILED